jgi:hypothetical protein
MMDISNVISNPHPSSLSRGILVGERGTWPHLDAIKVRIRIEMALETAIARLKKRNDLPERNWTKGNGAPVKRRPKSIQ